MSALLRLRERAAALPLDRAPLRRAGVLAALLVLLLVGGRALGPSRPAPADRQSLGAGSERVSARPERGVWTAGRVAALVLLAAGGGLALVLHRRAAPASPTSSALDVIETHALGPGQSLRLVACGDEVLLLSVSGDGASVLRHWPRERFDRVADAPALPFAEALASELAGAPPNEPAPLAEPAREVEPGGDSVALVEAAPESPAPAPALRQFGAGRVPPDALRPFAVGHA